MEWGWLVLVIIVGIFAWIAIAATRQHDEDARYLSQKHERERHEVFEARHAGGEIAEAEEWAKVYLQRSNNEVYYDPEQRTEYAARSAAWASRAQILRAQAEGRIPDWRKR